MPEKITWSLNVQVVGGPRLSKTHTIEVDAYDKINVIIADGATTAVQIQPGGALQVKFLLISSEESDPQLTYKVNDNAADPISLDAPIQLLMGDGAVGVLGAAPETLIFSNEQGKAASIQILVGRMTTP